MQCIFYCTLTIDENENVDSYKLTFVYKTEFTDNIDGSKFKTPRKNEKSKPQNDAEKSTEMCSHSSDNTRGVHCVDREGID